MIPEGGSVPEGEFKIIDYKLKIYGGQRNYNRLKKGTNAFE